MSAGDLFAPEQRAAVMRAVRSRDTKPELAVRAAVRDAGFARRYRLGGASLPGKPDLVFAPLRKVIFVHGCFWHGHDCRRGARMPKANAAYWRTKIACNVARDARTLSELSAAGWSSLVVWECEIRDRDALKAMLARFLTDS
jgi:DNA mismatch endonuclease (patch repair protein)